MLQILAGQDIFFELSGSIIPPPVFFSETIE